MSMMLDAVLPRMEMQGNMDRAKWHKQALWYPKKFEIIVVNGIAAWALCADLHADAYAAPIGEDGVIGEHWRDWAIALLGLLNGQTGNLDCGTLARFIRTTARENGVELPE